MTRGVSLSVNGVPIELDYFVQSFIDHTVAGMLEALEGTGEIETLEILLEGEKVKIKLNGAEVPLKAFVNKFIKNTLMGMVSSLKGVSEINRMHLSICR